jgi:hypothetical protein
MLALTKYSHRQNTRVDKILASTKYLRQQNTGVDKRLASTKYSGRQNVIAGAVVSPYYLARQSPQQLTSPRPHWYFPRPHWYSPTSPWRCWSLHMQSPSVVLPLPSLLLWVDSLPHCTGLSYPPIIQNMSQILASTKYWRPPRLHWFSPNNSSHYLCIGVLQKIGEN